MHFTYCPHCGEKLVQKEIGDEGKMPYCKNCEIPLWDSFTTCVICAVVNEQKEIALLRQNYVSADSYVCVAGVMKMGESAEKTAAREVAEEIGQKAEKITFVRSFPYEKKEMLMLGYKVEVKKEDLVLSGEVDQAQWFSMEEAREKLRPGSIAWQLVDQVINETMTVWNQSATAVVIKDQKVLLARHTYGGGKGKLIVPGGYLEKGESPEEAVRREYREETGVEIKPEELIGIRFYQRDWYSAFRAEYVAGDPRSDGDETREDVPDLTKKLIACALSEKEGWEEIPFQSTTKNQHLYGRR